MKNSRATFGHKSLVLNEHFSAANPPVLDRAKVQDTIAIDQLVIRPQYRDLKEALHLAQGGTAGRVHKGMLSMQLQGRILVPNATQDASLEDREKALRLAFDPYECYADSPTTDGVYPLSWLEPTLDTTNYATGWMPVTRYVRPVAQPETRWSVTDQSYRAWSVGLVAPDPRLYDATIGSLLVTPAGASGYFTMVNKGTIPGPLRVSIIMNATPNGGASDFDISLPNGVFVLNLTGLNAGSAIGVTMETCGPFGNGRSIYVDGVPNFSIKTSDALLWLNAPVGTPMGASYHNTAGISTILFEWGHARP